MAGIELGGGHAKKAVNQEIPLVPFIDFLLCCVMFLLVTAVWNQLTQLAVDAPPEPDEGAQVSEPPVDRVLVVLPDGYRITRAHELFAEGSAAAGAGPALGDALALLRRADPERTDLEIRAADGVEYADLVVAMDAAIGAGLTAPAISAASP